MLRSAMTDITLNHSLIHIYNEELDEINPLSANPTKWLM